MYLVHKGMLATGTDRWLATPLHRACYSGAETAVNYLCSWNKNLNQKECRGYTPLHFSVWSALVSGNLRPMKNLLLKGASRRSRVFF